jgi:ribA/ribD-fused uncharacterized protein
VEGNGKVHDYCGRTHAQQHGAMSSPRGGGRWGAGRTTGYARQGSGLSHSGWDNQTGPIYFYNRGEPCYEFTNFYEAVVEIDGQDWLTTEHYFQAQKFVGTPLVRTIRLMERPREAFDKSRDPRYSHWRRSDWEEVKEDIMFKALQAKFTQYQHLKKMLVGTKDRQLVERSPYDSYWGDGGDGSGKNRLGVLLMRLRDDLTPKPVVRAPSPKLPIHPGSPRRSSPVKYPPQKKAPVESESAKQEIEEWHKLKHLSELAPSQQQDPDQDGPEHGPHFEQPTPPDNGRNEQHNDGLAPQPTEQHPLQLGPLADPMNYPGQIIAIVHPSDATSMLSSQSQTHPQTMQVTMTASSVTFPSPSSGQEPSPTVTQPFNDLASTSSVGSMQTSEKPDGFLGTLTPEADLDRQYIRDRVPGSYATGGPQPGSQMTHNDDDLEDMDVESTMV